MSSPDPARSGRVPARRDRLARGTIRRVRVPVVIVTGFLGSGKTTLVNRLLARRAARGEAIAGKLGVIVNELGAVGIDGALLGDARQVELPGGCVCCVLGDDLERTVCELVDANPGLEAIVLETTGAAEPPPIAWALEREPAAGRVRLAACVTLVDALAFATTHAELARASAVNAIDAQLAYADVVLVTKAALAGDAATTAVVAAVRERNAQAEVRIASTDEHAAWLEQLLAEPDLDRIAVPAIEHHVHTDDCRHLDSTHAHGIDSVWTPADGVLDLEALEDALAELPGNYLRIKGIVHAVDERVGSDARWVAVHRVGLRVSSEPAPGAIARPVVVALGPGVRVDPLAACVLRASSLQPRPPGRR